MHCDVGNGGAGIPGLSDEAGDWLPAANTREGGKEGEFKVDGHYADSNDIHLLPQLARLRGSKPAADSKARPTRPREGGEGGHWQYTVAIKRGGGSNISFVCVFFFWSPSML